MSPKRGHLLLCFPKRCIPMKVLIIEPNWLGDVLFTTPAIRAVREKYKDVYISVIVHARCLPILEDNPNINEIIVLKNVRGLKGFFAKIKLIPRLKSKSFDIAFLFHRSMTRALMCVLAGIPERIGYHTRKRFFLLTRRIIPQWPEAHRVEYFLDVTRAADIDTDNRDYEFFIKSEVEKQIVSILNDSGISEGEPYFSINPGGNWPPKRWPKENFAKLADELADMYNTKVIITGAEKDVALGEDIKNLCNSKPINLCGKTTLKELAAISRRAKAVISNDTGPMHISVSQKTPTVALFGPTHPDITGPYGSSQYVVVKKDIGCPVPCYDKTCNDYRCMKAITVDDVMEAVASVITSEAKQSHKA